MIEKSSVVPDQKPTDLDLHIFKTEYIRVYHGNGINLTHFITIFFIANRLRFRLKKIF